MESKNTYYTEKFNDSYERIFSYDKSSNGANDDFYNLFLQIFTAKSEKISIAFNNVELKQQQKMMKASLMYLINVAGSKSLLPAVEHIAEAHSDNGYNIQPELYDHWLESLIDSVRAFDPKFDEDVALSWHMTVAPGISFMKYFYDKDTIYPQPEKNVGCQV